MAGGLSSFIFQIQPLVCFAQRSRSTEEDRSFVAPLPGSEGTMCCSTKSYSLLAETFAAGLFRTRVFSGTQTSFLC